MGPCLSCAEGSRTGCISPPSPLKSKNLLTLNPVVEIGGFCAPTGILCYSVLISGAKRAGQKESSSLLPGPEGWGCRSASFQISLPQSSPHTAQWTLIRSTIVASNKLLWALQLFQWSGAEVSTQAVCFAFLIAYTLLPKYSSHFHFPHFPFWTENFPLSSHQSYLLLPYNNRLVVSP